MLRNIFGNTTEKICQYIASYLNRYNITPNMLTITGLIINLIGGILFFSGQFIIAGWVILIAGLFDMLDGALARVTNSVSKIGAFTDSVADRYSDFFIFGGVCAYYARLGSLGGVLLCLGIITGAYLVSYVRARAELVIPNCAIGLMERPERIILLALGAFCIFFLLALWLLLIGTHVTAIQRIKYTFTYKEQ